MFFKELMHLLKATHDVDLGLYGSKANAFSATLNYQKDVFLDIKSQRRKWNCVWNLSERIRDERCRNKNSINF